ncbi:MAG: FAD:protein FMN transferase [Anaerolineae bacterium]|nr:FAD:protein FMN transferase [Anaerolineae bacterium]
MAELCATSFRAMGCQVHLWLETDEDGAPLLTAAAARIAELEAALSRFRPESELSRLNAQVGSWFAASRDLLANVQAAKQGARLTNGLYNPLVMDALERAGYDRSYELLDENTPSRAPIPASNWPDIEIDLPNQRLRLPARIDLGGVAKGWTAEVIADELAAHGPCLVDMGGDLVARGAPQGRDGWPVAVADPAANGDPLLTLSVTDCAVVTSGTDYRRWGPGRTAHHLIDPRTGQPAHTDVATVTIIHPQAATAEVYAKAVILEGSDAGLNWLNDQWDGAGLVVRQDGAVLATTRFERMVYEGVLP